MFIEKLKNRLQEVADKAQKQIEYVTSDDHQRRLEICRSCEHLRKPLNQCEKCGCLMDLKTKLLGAQCPIQKW